MGTVVYTNSNKQLRPTLTQNPTRAPLSRGSLSLHLLYYFLELCCCCTSSISVSPLSPLAPSVALSLVRWCVVWPSPPESIWLDRFLSAAVETVTEAEAGAASDGAASPATSVVRYACCRACRAEKRSTGSKISSDLCSRGGRSGEKVEKVRR